MRYDYAAQRRARCGYAMPRRPLMLRAMRRRARYVAMSGTGADYPAFLPPPSLIALTLYHARILLCADMAQDIIRAAPYISAIMRAYVC